ncbi:glyoxalase/bleomycin resistance protein/dihydroxybiphenyl dioxygenase [Lucifera butyrica]|uniref:Glyoxalase/bleomycin resistance protein/dihydroxybiphenyl dioxygenase n=1 Tax=Lucifera butyrica TaxID=1351585 RepID=A0A498R8S2_9FIRM|nr:VOC family protein [Lucifera butyrica]VBB06672.1 glyoxalase/bleomycin resistance protein/dihydroxybiphenyl dioxygenase [Lucifera butyrica]
MQIKRVDFTISTSKLQESKEFYMKYFDFRLVYESDWYIELIAPDMPTMGISFTLPQREEGEFFNGRGLILSFEVEDADAEYERLEAAGLQIYQELQNKPWGERSFVVEDPNGVHVYIYKSIPATPEYQRIYDSFKKVK